MIWKRLFPHFGNGAAEESRSCALWNLSHTARSPAQIICDENHDNFFFINGNEYFYSAEF